jgi:hypothetical protein
MEAVKRRRTLTSRFVSEITLIEQTMAFCKTLTAIRKIRRKRVEIMTNEGEKVQLRELVKKQIP